MHWSYIPSLQIYITGVDTTGTHFGKPGVVHIGFTLIALFFFLVQRIWSKRVNIFVVAINLAWGIKNFILMSMCSAGDCQEKQLGIYVLLIGSVGMMVMSLLPKIRLQDEDN